MIDSPDASRYNEKGFCPIMILFAADPFLERAEKPMRKQQRLLHKSGATEKLLKKKQKSY